MRQTESSALWALLLLAGGLQVAVAQLADVCIYEEDGTRLPLATHCSRFVVCQRGEVSIIGSCPRGLHFNRELGECDFQWRANCLGLSSFAGADDQCTCDCCADECQDPIDEEDVDETTTEDCGPDTTTKSPVTPSPPDSTDPTEVTTNPDDTTNSSNTTPASPGVVPTYCSSPRTDCVAQESGALLDMPGICVRFIQCSNGCVNEMPCPSGLYFSKELGRCDNPDKVDCEITADAEDEVVGPSGIACTSDAKCNKQPDGTMFADPNSNGYFICQCQCAIAMECDPQLAFNPAVNVCDWPKGNNTETGGDTGGGVSSVLCPSGLVYNATSDQCDYPEGYVPEVPCNSTSPVCKGQPEGELFQVPGSCNTFYKCNYNCAVEQLCPNNLIFDPENDICVYPDAYECEWEYTPPSGPNAGPSGTSCESNGRCLGKKEGTFLPSETNCGRYVVCQCECEVEMECSDGLYWDQSQKTCNYPNKVNCTL
ncbi:chondroitin proteoglycan 2 [Drosophila kikkawai]|uniref:Chondroitin proteoglycan 2 n=1 Tax=Drosophila kikkawai TaxID=30033 RepID=A0A6P4IEV6_DROKI|nr:chondroitin proteoglycan 2 [Drosophila kikkawai]